MKKQKLDVGDALKIRLKEIHGVLEKAGPYPLEDRELALIKGGCGGTCYVTCAGYCEAYCAESCMTYETMFDGGTGLFCMLLPSQNQVDWKERRRKAY